MNTPSIKEGLKQQMTVQRTRIRSDTDIKVEAKRGDQSYYVLVVDGLVGDPYIDEEEGIVMNASHDHNVALQWAEQYVRDQLANRIIGSFQQ